jgi:alpha-mannosidase
MKHPLLSVSLLAALSIAPLTAFAVGEFWPKSPIPVPPHPQSVAPGQTAPKVTDIWVIFKTHCDLGYTKTAELINTKYRVEMMDNAIRLYEADHKKPAEDRFKWTIAGWPMARNILGPLQDPARKAKIETALREGAFSVHALPASLETDVVDQEDLARGFIFASEVARKYGRPLPVSGKMTDVPAHAWIMPSLLANAGVPFLQIGCNYGVRGPIVPHLFFWEGPDGSRILCNYTPAYGSPATPPKGWPAKNYLAVIMTGDNKGPPAASEVAAVRATVAKMPGVKLHFGTMDDFYKAVSAEKLDLPVIKGDMVDPWVHGAASMPVEAAIARNNSPRASALGVLDTELKAAGLVTGDLAEPMYSVYENAMLFGEHTFGASSQWDGFWKNGVGGYLYGEAWEKARAAGKYKAIEASFDDKRGYIRKADAIVSRELDARLALLAKSVKADGDRVVVFNALPWARSGTVEVKPGVSLYAKDVPAGGWKTFPLSEARASGAEEKLDQTVLETAHYKVKIDLKRGGLASLVEKSTGRELADTTSPYAFGQFLHEKFSEAQTRDYFNRSATHIASCYAMIKPNMPKDAAYAALTPSGWTATHRRDATGETVTLTAGDTLGLAKGIAVAFTFPDAAPSVETTVRITGKTADPIPEGGWLCFPAAVTSPRFLLGRSGGVMDLAKDQIVGGNRYLFGVAGGASITSPDGSGMGLCALDAPLLSFGEPGLWKYDYTFVPKSPVAFVHLYNNMWNTNFPYWIDGDITSRVRVFPVKKAEAFVAPSCETRAPLLAAVATGAGGSLPAESAGLALSRKGVLVTAFGTDPDGNTGTLLRVWNQTEEGGALTVTLPTGFKATKARPVNFRGQKIGDAIAVSNGAFTFPLGKFAPASFVLE